MNEITKELREVAAKTEGANRRCGKLYRGDLDHIADRIDAEHERRMDDCRRETRRALVRYLRGVLTDYDKGIKRVRKGDKAEVVHCEDCMYARETFNRYACLVRPTIAHLVDADDYCSRGVRKEEDE